MLMLSQYWYVSLVVVVHVEVVSAFPPSHEYVSLALLYVVLASE